MATIHTFATKLTLATSEFVGGLRKSAESVGRFARSIVDATGIGFVFNRVFQTIATVLTGVFIAAAGLAVIETHHLARELGATTAGMLELEHAMTATGLSVESMRGAMRSLRGAINELSTGGVVAADVFQRIGIRADEILARSLDQNFLLIAQRLGAIADPIRRTALATQVFGRDAAALMPLLNQGAAGFQRFAEQARHLGLSLNGIQAERLTAAQRAIIQIQSLLRGVATQLAVHLAPLITLVANAFNNWIASGPAIGDVIGRAVEGIAVGMARIVDITRDAIAAIGQLLRGLQGIGQAAARLGGGLLSTLQPQLAAGLNAGIGAIAGGGPAGVGSNLVGDVRAFFARLREEAGAANATVGGASIAMQLNLLGAARAAATLAGNMSNATRAAELLATRGLQTIAANKTPLQQFAETMANLRAEIQGGAVDAGVFRRAAFGAFSALEQANQLGQVRLPGALRAGSAEAASVVIQAEAQLRGREDPQQRVQRVLEQTREIQRVQEALQRRIVEALENQPRAVLP